jgi:hypothetical protein
VEALEALEALELEAIRDTMKVALFVFPNEIDVSFMPSFKLHGY